jgi:protein tyrosine phosphatase (PTP) superfamily phosphohydrolase (DUF442 family)
MTDMTDVQLNTPRKRPRVGLALVSAIVLVAVGLLAYFFYFQTYHLVVVDPGKVYRNGHRSMREWKNSMRQAHAKTIVAVIDDEEYNQPEFVEERDYCKAHGIEYVWINVKAGTYPRPEQVKQFLAIATDASKQPVLYHDDEGIRRAGMMMAAYQMSALGYDRAKAKADIHAFNHSDRTIDGVRAFIDAYDPVNGLTVDLNQSSANVGQPTDARRTTTTASETKPAGE